MSMSVNEILDLGRKIIDLREEVALKQQFLVEYEEQVRELMKSVDADEIKSDISEVIIKRKRKEIEKFDSPAFKKADPEMYEEYRVPRKTFDQKKLKEEKTEIYEQYLIKETVENISIERYITKENLPSL